MIIMEDWQLVPKVATEAMIEHGLRAKNEALWRRHSPLRTTADIIRPMTAAGIQWTAMLKAAPPAHDSLMHELAAHEYLMRKLAWAVSGLAASACLVIEASVVDDPRSIHQSVLDLATALDKVTDFAIEHPDVFLSSKSLI